MLCTESGRKHGVGREKEAPPIGRSLEPRLAGMDFQVPSCLRSGVYGFPHSPTCFRFAVCKDLFVGLFIAIVYR